MLRTDLCMTAFISILTLLYSPDYEIELLAHSSNESNDNM